MPVYASLQACMFLGTPATASTDTDGSTAMPPALSHALALLAPRWGTMPCVPTAAVALLSVACRRADAVQRFKEVRGIPPSDPCHAMPWHPDRL